MTDITGRTIKVGDILAVGQRRGNSGALDIRVVAGFATRKTWSREEETCKTTSNGFLQRTEKTLIVPKELFVGSRFEEWINEQSSKIINKEG